MKNVKSHRNEHVKADIKRSLSKIIGEMGNSNIKSSFLSITKIDLSKDLSYCKIYISSLYGLEKCKLAVTSLNSSTGFIRCELAKRIKLRITPEIVFQADDSIEYGIKMSNKISSINSENS